MSPSAADLSDAGNGRLQPPQDDTLKKARFYEVCRYLGQQFCNTDRRSAVSAGAYGVPRDQLVKLQCCAQAMSFIESQLGAHELPFAMHHIYLPEEQRVPEVRRAQQRQWHASGLSMHRDSRRISIEILPMTSRRADCVFLSFKLCFRACIQCSSIGPCCTP